MTQTRGKLANFVSKKKIMSIKTDVMDTDLEKHFTFNCFSLCSSVFLSSTLCSDERINDCFNYLFDQLFNAQFLELKKKIDNCSFFKIKAFIQILTK